MSDFPYALSAAAEARVRQLLAKQGKSVLRVGVKGGGCSGYEYVLRPEHTARESDLTHELGDILLVCDPKSAEILDGTMIDLSGNLIGGGFTFDNPNASRSCGCGTSFSVKPKAS